MKIRRMLRSIVYTCKQEDAARKKLEGVEKNAWERESSPTHKGAVRCLPYGPSFFYPPLYGFLPTWQR